MKAIKTLVIFMGVLLLAGLGLLAYGLYAKTGKPAKGAPVTAVSDFGQVGIPVPSGARLDQVLVVGERVVLRLSGGGPDRLVVLDPASGHVSGGFTLVPEAPTAK